MTDDPILTDPDEIDAASDGDPSLRLFMYREALHLLLAAAPVEPAGGREETRKAFFLGMEEAARMVERQDVSGTGASVAHQANFATVIRMRSAALESIPPAAAEGSEEPERCEVTLECGHTVTWPTKHLPAIGARCMQCGGAWRNVPGPAPRGAP